MQMCNLNGSWGNTQVPAASAHGIRSGAGGPCLQCRSDTARPGTGEQGGGIKQCWRRNGNGTAEGRVGNADPTPLLRGGSNLLPSEAAMCNRRETLSKGSRRLRIAGSSTTGEAGRMGGETKVALRVQ